LTWLVIGSVLFSTLPVAGLFVVRETTRQAEARWSVMKTAADVLASGTEDAVAMNDRGRAFNTLRAVTRTPGVTYARVEAHDGSVIAEMGAAARLKSDVSLNAESRHPSVMALVTTRTIQVHAPVMNGGHQIGQVVIVHRSEDFARTLLQALAGVFGLAILVLAIALYIARRLQTAMIRPLTELTASVDAIAHNGDYTRRVETKVDAKDEVGTLVTGFNAMIDAIRIRDGKLEAHLIGLENQVAERTRDYQDARDEALAANAAKSDFLATMSHEIRTPMNGVMVMAELLAAESLPARAKRHARTIAKSGRTLLAVINDILDFSKIEAGKLEVETCEVDILDLVDDTVMLFQARAREKGLELVVNAHPEAPRLVPADPVRMGQVVSNLISNALKFTEKGYVIIAIEPDKKSGFWRLVVKDTGIGIARDKLGTIFAAFSQEDQTTTRRFGGTGLGLSISKRLIEAMGGAIAVTSEQGKGTQFHVRMPALEGSGKTCAPPVIHDLVRPVVHIFVRGDMENDAVMQRFQQANVRFGPDKPRLVLADEAGRMHLDAGVKPECLVLLAHPEDREAEQWVSEGRAACVLPRPLRHRDLDALIERLRDDEDLVLYDTETDPEGVDASYPKARVLVVDDGEVNREVAIEALARFGIAANVAVDGADALAKMSAETFDLVLMDGSMPVMDGFEATRQWRAKETSARLPIVALTAHVVGHAAQAWKEAGMDDVLHKPFSLSDMAQVLRSELPEALREAPMRETATEEAVVTLPEDDADLFDRAVLGSLVEGINKGRGDFVRRVVELYRSHGPQAAAAMQAAHAEGDEDRLARSAHALKSMSLNIGAKAVSGVAGAIERAIRVEHRAVSADEIALAASWVERTLAGLAVIIDGEAKPEPAKSKTKKKTAPVVAAPKDDPEAALVREMEADIAANAFEMEYQPIYDRTGTDVISAEALMRWHRGDRTPIGPAVFIPVAERSGLITRLGTFARRRVLETTAGWDIPVAINVSPIELDKPGFVAGVRALLNETGFDPKRLVLEVTETAFLGEPDRVRQLFNELRNLGIKLALDDFGVGYSSLTALHRFPFDKIKIDREFVMALDGEPRAALEALAIIQAVTGIGRAFGMQVVAEGIETGSQHSHLKAAGVHAMQGYLFGKPMAASSLGHLLGKAVKRA
jgi:signal transduction histidine kinase/EAL domain-containing protein (putative c-di-GMP-specific phosphodiesterase class I)/FixJ family two-component response regulator